MKGRPGLSSALDASPNGADRSKKTPDPFFQRDEISGKAYDIRLMWRLWAYVRPYRRTFLLSVVSLIAATLALLVQPYLLKIGIDRYLATRDFAGLTRTAILFIVATVAELAFFYQQYYLTMVVAQRALSDLRIAVFAHLQQLPVSFFDRNPVGRLVTRMTTDVDVINEMFAAGALTIFMDGLTLLGIIAVLFALDARLALVTLSMMPVMVLAIDFFRVRARVSYRRIREQIARINAFLQEAISGMTVIQLFVREKRTFEEFDRLNESHREANHLSNLYEAALFSLVEAVSSISVALTVWYAGGRIVAGAIAFGTLVAFVEYVQKFFVPIRDFSTKYAVMQSAMAAAERVFALLDTPTVSDADRTYAPARVEGRVEFDHVWFAYRGDEWVLRDVTFHVDPGETVAIVGATGSGKTTLIKLLAGFYAPGRGAVRIDGVDVCEWRLDALRRNVGMVLQDVTVFSGDVAWNVTLGRPDIDRARMEAAARTVHAHRFITRLPRGYDEPVRERGNNFSTGQRQLLSFARALAHDPAILVLDEATSSVDPDTEGLIQDALEKLLQGRTAILIAHRLSTIERADRIVVIHRGEVREIGTHAELLARGGIYAKLHRLQFVAAEADPPAGSRVGA
ncbi:MAG: ATP-binding cassette, subfamily multidrug efflux pump [Candidatus Binatota bacterium]|jgi:ATP-binding cassette subfamily B protein|nr:ATP-binding cassette, subfamily multidrug efflux pump [Candidatus Binatota bacterium]